jgi:hypothetical protein
VIHSIQNRRNGVWTTLRPTARLGGRLLDYSHAGYRGGAPPPTVPAHGGQVIAPVAGDANDSARIQAAIDRVSALPADGFGRRGAVLIKAGRCATHAAIIYTACSSSASRAFVRASPIVCTRGDAVVRAEHAGRWRQVHARLAATDPDRRGGAARRGAGER